MHVPDWAGFSIMIAVMALVMYANSWWGGKRNAGLEQFALETGLVYYGQPDTATAEDLAQVQVKMAMDQRNPRFGNVMRGIASGLDTIIADRLTGYGRTHDASTIVAFKFSTPFPDFVVCSENILWHIVEKFGYSDIDIDGAPEFSRRFLLHGQDQHAISALFRLEVTQAFEQIDKEMMPTINTSGQWLVFQYPGWVVTVKHLRHSLPQAQAVAEAFRQLQTSSVFR